MQTCESLASHVVTKLPKSVTEIVFVRYPIMITELLFRVEDLCTILLSVGHK